MESLSPGDEVPDLKNGIAIFRGRHRALTPLGINQQVIEVGRSGRMVRLAPDVISVIWYGGDTLISEGLMGSRGVSDQSWAVSAQPGLSAEHPTLRLRR